jgi:transcriptional regulator with XRE-family HTH domain
MGDATSRAVQRFFTDALARVDKAEDLAQRIEPLVGRKSSKTVTAWARGDGRPLAEVMLATAKTLRMSIDEYLDIERREETAQEAIGRIDDTVATLRHDLDELRQSVGDLLEKEQADAGRRQAGEVG